MCMEHLKLSIYFKGLREGIKTFRKYYSGYLHGMPGVAKLRSELMMLKDFNAITDKLQDFLHQSTCLSASQ